MMRNALAYGAVLLMASLPARASDALAAQPEFAVWVRPVGALLFGVLPLGGSAERWFYLPVGTTILLSDRVGLELDASVLAGNRGCDPDSICQPFSMWQVGMGVPLSPFGNGGMSGFFVGPRISIERWTYSTARGGISGDAVIEGGDTFQVLLGADLGYRWVLGPIFLALETGASVGYADDRIQALAGSTYGSSKRGLFVGGNLHLFRMGAAF